MEKLHHFGNTSQSIVSVPNIFLIRDIKPVETFKIRKKDKYFREKNLLAQAQQLNINNNPVKNNRKLEEYNKTKYIPINQLVTSTILPKNSLNIHYLRNYTQPKKEITTSNLTTTEVEENKFNNNSSLLIVDDNEEVDKRKKKDEKKQLGLSLNSTGRRQTEYQKFEKEFEKHNITTYTNPELIKDIKNDIGRLIGRINANFDAQKWSEADTRSVFNKTNDIMYTPITYYNMHNESETSKFHSTLQQKIGSLSTINESKFKVLNVFNKNTKYKNLNGKETKIDYSKILPSSYPTIDENYIKDMTDKNHFLFPKFKPTVLYNEFPSATFNEFTKKRGELFQKKRKEFLKNLSKEGLIEKSRYNCSNYDSGNNYILNDY